MDDSREEKIKWLTKQEITHGKFVGGPISHITNIHKIEEIKDEDCKWFSPVMKDNENYCMVDLNYNWGIKTMRIYSRGEYNLEELKAWCDKDNKRYNRLFLTNVRMHYFDDV